MEHLNMWSHTTVILSLIPLSAVPREQLQPGWQSVSNQANQAGKQPKQTAGGWAMAGRCSSRSELTPRRDGLMTNWCSSSITLSTFSTPVGLLNGSFLFVLPLTPHFSLSLFLSPLTPIFTPLRGLLQPLFTRPVSARGRHRGSLIASYCQKAKIITLTAPTHTDDS